MYCHTALSTSSCCLLLLSLSSSLGIIIFMPHFSHLHAISLTLFHWTPLSFLFVTKGWPDSGFCWVFRQRESSGSMQGTAMKNMWEISWTKELCLLTLTFTALLVWSRYISIQYIQSTHDFFCFFFFSLLRLVWDSWHCGNSPFTDLFDGFCGFYRLKGESLGWQVKKEHKLLICYDACIHAGLVPGATTRGFRCVDTRASHELSHWGRMRVACESFATQSKCSSWLDCKLDGRCCPRRSPQQNECSQYSHGFCSKHDAGWSSILFTS